jgi:hypothetical protein
MTGLFERFWNRRNNYRAVFNSEAGIKVLADLREFCRADASCVVVSKDGKIDTHATVLAEGRREVWLRITETLNLTDEQLFVLRSKNEDQ